MAAVVTSRWKPLRAGIFNIWEYDDQVFDFGDGRLVIRGNQTGKILGIKRVTSTRYCPPPIS